MSASFLLLFDYVFQNIPRFQFGDWSSRVNYFEEAFEHRDLFFIGLGRKLNLGKIEVSLRPISQTGCGGLLVPLVDGFSPHFGFPRQRFLLRQKYFLPSLPLLPHLGDPFLSFL